MRKTAKNSYWRHHWKEPEKPFPIRIKWVIIAGSRDLHPINLNDVVFDVQDLKDRKINHKEFLEIHGSTD